MDVKLYTKDGCTQWRTYNFANGGPISLGALTLFAKSWTPLSLDLEWGVCWQSWQGSIHRIDSRNLVRKRTHGVVLHYISNQDYKRCDSVAETIGEFMDSNLLNIIHGYVKPNPVNILCEFIVVWSKDNVPSELAPSDMSAFDWLVTCDA
jgi:hypothetical protein